MTTNPPADWNEVSGAEQGELKVSLDNPRAMTTDSMDQAEATFIDPNRCRCGRELKKLNEHSDTPKCVGCGRLSEWCICTGDKPAAGVEL